MMPVHLSIFHCKRVYLFSLRQLSSPYQVLSAFANAPEKNDVGGGPLWGSEGRSTAMRFVERRCRRADLAWMPVNHELAGLGEAQHLAPRPVTIVLRDGQGRFGRRIKSRECRGSSGPKGPAPTAGSPWPSWLARDPPGTPWRFMVGRALGAPASR